MSEEQDNTVITTAVENAVSVDDANTTNSDLTFAKFIEAIELLYEDRVGGIRAVK